MSYSIAIAGKGGSGKTTIASLIISILLRTGRKPVLAVDADPNSNLNELLGVRVERTVVNVADKVMEGKNDLPAGLTKERVLELYFQDALIESNGFDLLVMGRTEGPGCYCHANNLLRNLMDRLQQNYPYVVMDNEAGMEHLSRRTTRNADALLVVANPHPVSLKSAQRIFEVSGELNLVIKERYLVINETTPSSEILEIETKEMPLLARIPYDREVERLSLSGSSLLNLTPHSVALRSVHQMVERLLPKDHSPNLDQKGDKNK